ncbi:DUF7666 domain-containing protein [Luteimonas sp. RIT-PG2_3]
MAATKKKTVKATEPTVIAFKGFDKDLKCRGFQYAIGETATHTGPVKACNSGLHACEYPLDVLGYYAPIADDGTINRFAVVEASGEISRHDDDTKIAAARLTLKAEIKIPELVTYAVKWILDRIDSTVAEGGDQSAATNTGNRSAATNTGNRSAATNTGDQSAATNTGNQSAATNTGYQSAATNTGYQSAATNTGYQSAATNTGNRSAATNTGYQSAASVEGPHSVAISTGYQGRAKANEGSAIMLVERNDEMEIVSVFAGVAGRDGLLPDVWYSLQGGKPVKVEG